MAFRNNSRVLSRVRVTILIFALINNTLAEMAANQSDFSEASNQTTNLASFPNSITEKLPTSDYKTDVVLKHSLESRDASPEEEPSITTTVLPERTFKDEEKAIVNYVNYLLRQMLPLVMRSAPTTTLSPGCTSAMMKAFAGLRRLSGWTLKLLDSMGKPASGILTGRSYSLGDYDQCLGISVTKRGKETTKPDDEMFHGKYCVIHIQQKRPVIDAARQYHEGKINGSQLGKLREMIEASPFVPVSGEYMSHYVGVCIPSVCTEIDVETVLKTIPFPGALFVKSCESKSEMKLDLEQRIVIGVLAFLIILVVFSSIADKMFHLCSEQSRNFCISNKCVNIIISFSICFNTRKLVKRIRNDCDEIPDWRCVRGLLVIAVVCIIISHTYLSPLRGYYKTTSYLGNLEEYLEKRSFSLIVCLPIVIEIFFFSYGFLIANKIWKSSWGNKNAKINVFKVAVYNYCKLCIPLLFCTGIIILLPMFGSGPFWNDIFGRMENCKWKWWRILGMYSNFLDIEEQCFPHFWFVPCLMQIILFSLILMPVLSRWPRFGLLVTLCAIFGAIIAVGIATFRNELPPSFVDYFADRSNIHWDVQRSWPLIHLPSFCFGMFLGILMAKKAEIKVDMLLVLLGWILSLGIIIGVCMILMFYHKGPAFFPTIATAVYGALQKPLFTLAISWIALICAYRYGGSVNSVLSWSVLDPLYKLSYLAYLIHLILMAFHAGTTREYFHYSHTELIFRSVAYIVLSYAAAYIAYMLVVMPFKSLQVAIFSPKLRQTVVVTPSKNGYATKKIPTVLPNYHSADFFNNFNVQKPVNK